jgi:hypothetical protein
VQSIVLFSKNIIFVLINNLINMKNLKKLTKSSLKKISGGNAPQCEGDTVACRHKAEGGVPAYWTCEPAATGCRFL